MDENYESVKTAFWVDIKSYLLKNPEAKTIKFRMHIYNELSKDKYRKYFYNIVCGKLPKIAFQEAILLLRGDSADKKIAMDILQIVFSYEVETWEKLFSLYNERDGDIDYSVFFEAISYAYEHPDHWISKGMYEFSAESEKYVRCKVDSFSEEDIINVLSIIENHYYDRGTFGQTADIIISNISHFEYKLLNIVMNPKIDYDLRYDAEIILAHQNKGFYMQHVDQIKCMESECTELIVQYIEDFGEFDLY